MGIRQKGGLYMADYKNCIHITWHGHSCFEVEADGYRVVLDPYKDGSVEGLSPLALEADAVLCSHSHGDHNAVEVVSMRKDNKTCPFQVEILETYHDDVKGTKRGPNKIHILSWNGIRVAHLGDLGCRLSDSELETIGALDAAMIPVGGFYTISGEEAAELAKRLQAVVTIPMHYRSDSFGFGVLSTLDPFLKAYSAPVTHPGPKITICKGLEKQIAVLEYQP